MRDLEEPSRQRGRTLPSRITPPTTAPGVPRGARPKTHFPASVFCHEVEACEFARADADALYPQPVPHIRLDLIVAWREIAELVVAVGVGDRGDIEMGRAIATIITGTLATAAPERVEIRPAIPPDWRGPPAFKRAMA